MFRRITIFGLIGFLFLIYVYLNLDLNLCALKIDYDSKEKTMMVNTNQSSEVPQFIDLFDTCPLTVFDPFYKDMGLTIRYKNPLEGCNKKYSPMTKLEHGFLSTKKSSLTDFTCRARCYNYVHSTKSQPGEWKKIEKETKFDCDFVHAECLDDKKKILDSYLHTQIVENDKSTILTSIDPPPKAAMPDIYIFVLDSVSSTQARRSLPRTLSFLETEMGGMHMHHLNKVGENSRPNGFAMFMRYKTMFSDDYPDGHVFTWNNCKGFKSREANHVFGPFNYAYKTHKPLREHVWAGNCLEKYALQLDYVSKFANAYKGKNKFVVNWMSEIAHDDPNLLFHGDGPYEEFFRANQKNLENAFIFFMADHGPRFGALMSNLRENSFKLLTQFDVFATLSDILKYSPQSNFTDFSFIPMDESKINNGTSILRPLGPFSHRNCRNVPTDASYCLCEYRKTKIDNPSLSAKMGADLVKNINRMIDERKVSDLCPVLRLEKVINFVGFAPTNRTGLYEILIRTKPGDGEFKSTYKSRPGEAIERTGDIMRVNSYGKAGDCVKNLPDLKPFCFCNDMNKLKMTKKP